MRRQAGKVSIGSIVVLALIVTGGYFGAQYLPVLMQKSAAKDIARVAAAKMVVEPNDSAIRELIHERAKEKGLVIPQSEVVLRRNYPNAGMFTVELHWSYQMKHVWGKTKVMKLAVAEIADQSGGRLLRNAE